MMKNRNHLLAAASLFMLTVALPATAQERSVRVIAEDLAVPAGEPGVNIYVRNKHPEGMTTFTADRTLVFVHGATYPASTSFDLQLDGISFMDDIAEHGFDVYAIDLPGYGKSSRPEQMSKPADANAPFETTADAVRHYGAVVDYVLKRRSLPKLDVMGWSWGTTIAAGYAAEQSDKVERLVLYAPVWIVHPEAEALGGEGKLGAYRSVTAEQARQRWLNGVPEVKKSGLIPQGWFDAWQQATWATDPAAGTQNPPSLRAPNGVIQDLREYWRSDKPTYDPAKIAAPTLMVQGEWDHDTPPYMSQTLFPLIVNAPWKRYVEIGEGTHTIMMERNRRQLFYVVESFLMEPVPGALSPH
ncbi:MAG: alpha/beta fold hydrolase [Acetobacteraceae bacterium]|nr:alpha/beta fold hydrolase [Acetobacteraceae bacterium]